MAIRDDSTLAARLTLLRQTDAEAFLEALFEAYYQPLGVVIYRVVPDRAVVEDLLQDLFLRVWHGRDALPPITSYRAYLTRMALNAALRYKQREQRQVSWDADPPPDPVVAPDVLAKLHADETGQAIAAAVALLPPQCRLIFELSRYEDLNCQQIAESLELAPKTVENQLGKALRLLRQALAGVMKDFYCLLICCLTAKAALPAGIIPPGNEATPNRQRTYFAARLGVIGRGRYPLPYDGSFSPPKPI